jgi:hypothetical protein
MGSIDRNELTPLASTLETKSKNEIERTAKVFATEEEVQLPCVSFVILVAADGCAGLDGCPFSVEGWNQNDPKNLPD